MMYQIVDAAFVGVLTTLLLTETKHLSSGSSFLPLDGAPLASPVLLESAASLPDKCRRTPHPTIPSADL